MYNKKYFTFFLAAVFFLVGSVTAFAQTAPVMGKVELRKADGTTEPVSGATVEVFRTDIKGKLPSGKTNKKGEFSFAGLPLGATFVFSISGPGISPEIRPNIKAGTENVVITVNPGDGKKWTEDEVRKAVAGGGTTSGSTTNTAGTSDAPKMTEEQKKAQEERAKLEAEIAGKNKKIEESNATIQKALAEGNQAFNSRNYDLAVVKFEEGYQASPDYVGSAPVLLNNKGIALRSRAVNTYNENVKATDPSVKVAAMTKVRQDLADAVESYNKSWAVLKSAPAADITDQKTFESTKMETLRGAKEALRLMAATEQVDTAKTDEAKALIAEYITLETDQAKKVEAQRILGDVYRVVGDSDNAIAEYKKVLEIEPNDPDALAGLGLSLVNLGFINNDKTKFQEGANYLQRYADTAPAGHKYIDDAKGLIETLKKEQSVTPQKTPARRKN